MSTAAPRSLADQLRSWSDQELAHLVGRRPDLAVPAPQDSTQLASRAAARPSVLRILDQLDLLELTVLEAAVVLGAGARSDEVVGVVRADPEPARAALDELRAVALLWGTDDDLRPLSVLPDVLGPLAAGTREAVRRDSDDVRAALAAVSDAARALLDHVEGHGLVGTVEHADRVVTPERARTPVEELLAHGLLVATDARHVAVPPDVAIVLRGGRTTREDVGTPPPLATAERSARLVDSAAAGAAVELVQRVELLLESWGAAPPGVLRTGGLGVRDLKAAAALLGTDDAGAALVCEVAASAHLLAMGEGEDGAAVWLPTDAFDLWRSRPTAQQWADLAAAWLALPRAAGLVRTRDAKDRPRNALGDGLDRPWLPRDRRDLLAALGELRPGEVLAATTGPPSLAALLEWRRPRRPAERRSLLADVLEEAAVLGVTALGGLSAAGRGLLAGDPADALAPLIPDPVDHILLQADLTAVAPGPLEHELAMRLATVADVESRGGATVYRFDAQTVRRAFDAGWSAQEVQSFIAESSRTPVPQPLVYLIDDVARRFGTVRVGSATAFLRSDDEQALTELVHDPRAAALRLRRIAPTVVVTDAPTDVLMTRLRELGVAPVLEAADGTVRVARRAGLRAATPRAGRGEAVAQVREAARVSAVVRAVRAGDRAVAARPVGEAPGSASPAAVLALLRDAVEASRTVWIGYTDNHGSVSERVVEPRRVDGGWLTAYDSRADDERAFALHRITAVRPL